MTLECKLSLPITFASIANAPLKEAGWSVFYTLHSASDPNNFFPFFLFLLIVMETRTTHRYIVVVSLCSPRSVSVTMEGGLPMLNCLLQHTLRSLCSCSDSSNSSKWVYAVFWRILPRNYPPPK